MMEIFEVIAKVAGPEVLAALAAFFTAAAPAILAFRKNKKARLTWSADSSEPKDETLQRRGSRLIVGYAVILVIFGAITVIHYWDMIKQQQDTAFSGVGLVLAMVGGMFVQVLTANYKAGDPLFHVTTSQLVYPLLFSPIVFYPVWMLHAGASNQGSNHVFAFYAAFLDGFFWESIVSSAKPRNSEPKKLPRNPRHKREKNAPITAQPV
jgi:hypothetical protein